ncbi:hypothetical protein SteCoe_10147 [Stentor coeruleus]|uniref:Calmodulin n=1 Tax=Stentor coeruleus TaxID=5963 RepID=A0A1R2CG61_9CILI|nr:hypothetical protein SteCoe_10147 [Stentor coeruleus]
MFKCKEENLKEVFDVLDRDHNGYLNANEFSTAVRVIGLNPTEADIKEILEEADKDFDGVLNFEEFVGLYKTIKIGNEKNAEDILGLFNKCKENADGFITIEELKEILSGDGEPLYQEEIKRIIKHFDKNKTGKINVEELIKGLLE